MSEAKGNNLLDVHTLINGDRHEEHGEFEDNVSKISYYMHGLTGKEYTREEARCFFIALKLCRVHNGTLGNDTLNDLVGYLALIKDDIDNHGQSAITSTRKDMDQDRPVPGGQARNENWANRQRRIRSMFGGLPDACNSGDGAGRTDPMMDS